MNLLHVLMIVIASVIMPAALAAGAGELHYVTTEQKGGTRYYGYATSDSEIIWVSYAGKKDGEHVVDIREESQFMFHSLRCKPPCEIFIEETFQPFSNKLPQRKTYVLRPDMVAAAIIADVLAGKLVASK